MSRTLNYPPFQIALVLIMGAIIGGIFNIGILGYFTISAFIYTRTRSHILYGDKIFYSKKIAFKTSLVLILPLLITSVFSLALYVPTSQESQEFAYLSSIPVLGPLVWMQHPGFWVIASIIFIPVIFLIVYLFGGIGELLANKIYGIKDSK